MINQQPGLRVVLGRASGEEPAPPKVSPVVVLLDTRLRRGESLRIAEKTREAFPGAKVIVMDSIPAKEDIAEYVNAGVRGFLLKDATLDELVSTVRAVAAGENVIPTKLENSLISKIATNAAQRGGPRVPEAVKMTPRERQVIHLIAQGMSNKEIAAHLRVAVHTVKSHVRNVMEKLTLHSRLQIAAYVHRQERT